MRRRQYLTAAGVSIAGLTAGCSGGDNGNGGGSNGGGSNGGGSNGGGTNGGGGTTTGGNSVPQSVEDLPSPSNYEEYRKAWLDLATRKIEDEGNKFTVFGFSSTDDRQYIKDTFANAPEPFNKLQPQIPLGNNDTQLQKYAQATKAKQSVTDVLVLGNLGTLRISEQVPMGQMDDIPKFIEYPDNVKVQEDELGDLIGQEVLDRGINYNTNTLPKDMVEQELKSWGDLMKEEFAGVTAVMDFTFSPAVAEGFLNTTFTDPEGNEITQQELVEGIKENLDFRFVASATEGAAMAARGDAAMQLMGAGNFIVPYVEDGLPVDHARSPDTLWAYANPFAKSAYPNNDWAARLATEAFLTLEPLLADRWGQIPPDRSFDVTHDTLGSSLALYEGVEINTVFDLEDPASLLTEYQQLWGAPV